MLREAGRVEEALAWYGRAADAGDPVAMGWAAEMLREAGRVEEATRLLAYGWEPDGSIAEPWSGKG